MQSTTLMFNKNNDDAVKLEYEDISIIKSKIDGLSLKHNLNPNSLFLAATCIALTKYTNSTQIFIKARFNICGKSHEVPLKFNDTNRKRTVLDYINKLSNSFLSPDMSMEELDEQSHFNYLFNDLDDADDLNTSLIIDECDELYRLQLKFDSSKYTFSYIQSFLRSIKKVLIQFADYGIENLKVEDIALRDEKPPIKYELKRPPLLNVLLENQANKTPDKIALRTCGKSYAFKEINDESNRIANALIKRGIEKGSSISFMLARDKTLITTFLGIVKAGCVAIPLDMNYPAERIRYIRENSNSKYIITRESIDGAIDPEDLLDETDDSFPKVDLKPDDPIFLLYTSGSTGNPKGVISTHCGISNLTGAHIKTNYKSILSVASIAFDISEEDILLSLTNDMELVFANDDEIKDVVLLANLIDETRPEFLNITPSRFLSYIQIPEFKLAIRHLKGISCGGEPFTRNVYDSIKSYADIDIYNGYGPLETSLTSNSKKIENPDFITNGKPLLNYVTDVRDIDDKLLPYGVIGQLYIGGIGVSKGYYNLEEKTREVFIRLNGLPYYKSGDNAVELPSGEIIIKGRSDHQIKLRGQRVDPEEIEQVIIRYGKINNAIVVIHEINNEMHLCGYFTSKSQIDIGDLREYLERFLSPYMVPTFLIQLDKFPETPSGKIDRKMLPKPELDTENIKPANDLEEAIFEFSKEILNHDDFGVTDNLFKLGFTSLTLMRLNSDIYHRFNINLKHSDLMSNPTIRKLSVLIANSKFDDIEEIELNASNKYPMSSQQKRLYVLYCKNPDLTNYNLPNIVKLNSSIDIDRLEYAVNKVIESEEILRTSLHVENGEYIQKIHDNRPIKVDLIILDENEDIGEVFKQNIQPFILENDPLIRIKVIESKGEFYVFRDMHHSIGDQISNDLLYEKIRDAYYGNPLSESQVQYKDYAVWLKKQLAKEAEYWKGKEFSDFGTVLMTDFERPLNQTFNGNRISYKLDKEIIEKIARDKNTTVYKLLLLQFIVLLHKCTGESEIQIGTVTSGRTHPIFEKTLGMFVNTLPLLQSVSAEDTLKETLIKTEEELAKLFANQNYSIEEIIEDHKISTNNSYNPLFSIAFIQNTADDFSNDLDWDESKFDLTCTIKNGLNDLSVELEYNMDLYSFEKVNGLLKHYLYLIDNIDENMDRKIGDIDILSIDEKERIIEMAGFDLEVEYDSILNAFKMQVKKNPGKAILSDCESSLSYNDLDLKTNSLANYIKDNYGIKEQDNIVLIANRSIESVLAFYSILKLNAVYVPISPFAPKMRIRHIIDELDAKLVLTNIDLDIDGVSVVDLRKELLYDYDLSQDSFSDIQSKTSSEDKLCIIHTSGTTGLPKGVEITHENVLNFLINAKNAFYDKNSKIFYHTTNIGFDTSLFEIIFSILNGIELHVIDENYDFSRIPESLLNQRSMINTVPAKLQMFLSLPNFKNIMENLGQLILAGEPLNESLVAEIRKDYNPDIFNAYGPCEATIFASIKKVNDKISIGKANANSQIYILNENRQLCPIGIPGELCIGGKQVSLGYYNNDDETKSHFIQNPFAEGTLYCTGDLAYMDNDGEINFIGRKDTQIKINGQRIELDEINRQIEKHNGIIQAVTVANSKGQLHSYVVSDEIVDMDLLLNDLGNVLLPFMLPVSIMQIDSIPINNNGKIDFDKLPQPQELKYEYIGPSNALEESIVDVWENVLDVRPIGINDNFYRLGGDSIKAIRIVSLLQNEGIICSPRDILNYKTPYLIARNLEDRLDGFLSNRLDGSSGSLDNRFESYSSIEGIFNLLPIQDYFFNQINRNDYTQEFILKSSIDLDINLLQKALDELTNLHDILRARFILQNDKYMQEILPLDTRVCKINELEINGDFEDEIKEIINNAKRSLDTFNKLIDVSLIRHNDSSYLVFVIHHLIIDGVSWSILLDDLTYIYNHLASNLKINLNKPYSYVNWISDVKRLLESISDDEKNHWIEVNGLLDDREIKGTAKGFNFNIDASYSADNLLMLKEEEYIALAIARAYKKTYGRDIIFNRESYGRDESLANLSRTVGWFTSQYPVAINISTDYDDLSIAMDACQLKTAFGDVRNLGLNYASLIYIAHELEYRHCPVTFNFLSTEFIFENKLFKSVDYDLDKNNDVETYGVDFNINRIGDVYSISGDYPEGTYIADKFGEFVENIKSEIDFIGNFTFNENKIVSLLSESQLEIYFNEMSYDMGNAYSTVELVECPLDKSIDDIKEAINALIEKHPILKGRIIKNENPLLICDSYPLIEVVDSFTDYSEIMKPFDLEKHLARFFIIDRKDSKAIAYDIHHIINDATGFKIIENDLNSAFEGNLDNDIDLGFAYASRDSFESKFDSIYQSAHEFYIDLFAGCEIKVMEKDLDGSRGIVSLPICGIKDDVEEFSQNNNITVGTFLNAVFSYAYSRFIDSEKVYYNFVEHGRHEAYTQDSLGMFARTNPILVDYKGDLVKGFLDYFSDLSLNCMINNVYPFRLLEKEFNLNNIVLFEYNLDLNDVSNIGHDLILRDTSKDSFADFFCVINDLDDGYVIHVNHSDIFSRDTAVRFVRLYAQILNQMMNKEYLDDI